MHHAGPQPYHDGEPPWPHSPEPPLPPDMVDYHVRMREHKHKRVVGSVMEHVVGHGGMIEAALSLVVGTMVLVIGTMILFLPLLLVLCLTYISPMTMAPLPPTAFVVLSVVALNLPPHKNIDNHHTSSK